MYLNAFLRFATVLCAVTTTVVAGNLWRFDGLLRVHAMSSIIIGDYLYLDGGELLTMRGNLMLASTLRIPLQSSWSTSNITAEYTDKPVKYPFSRAPEIWTDGSNLYTAGGVRFYFEQCIPQMSCSTSIVWKANSRTHIGSSINASGDFGYANTPLTRELINVPIKIWRLPLDSFQKTGIHWAESPYQIPKKDSLLQADLGTQYGDKFYAMGGFYGYGFSNNGVAPVKGIASWNTKDGTDWKNGSTADFKPHGTAASGQAVPAPFGEEGAIVYIGGFAEDGPFTYFDKGNHQFMNMAMINVYDIKSGTFVSQKATGNIPKHRWDFCAVGVSEKGSGTFDIFVFGGHYNLGGKDPKKDSLRQVYVLSLPSFIWMKVPGAAEEERAGATCQIIGHRQMMVVGGFNPNDGKFPSQDPWDNKMKLFDVSTWEWKTIFDPSVPGYKRSQYLGPSTQTYPPRWDSVKVKALFDNGTFVARQPRQPRQPSNTDIGAIVGGVVGGVVGIALILGIIIYWYFSRSKKAKTKRTELGEKSLENISEAPNTPAPQELEHKPTEIGVALSWEMEATEHSVELSAEEKSLASSAVD